MCHGENIQNVWLIIFVYPVNYVLPLYNNEPNRYIFCTICFYYFLSNAEGNKEPWKYKIKTNGSSKHALGQFFITEKRNI